MLYSRHTSFTKRPFSTAFNTLKILLSVKRFFSPLILPILEAICDPYRLSNTLWEPIVILGIVHLSPLRISRNITELYRCCHITYAFTSYFFTIKRLVIHSFLGDKNESIAYYKN